MAAPKTNHCTQSSECRLQIPCRITYRGKDLAGAATSSKPHPPTKHKQAGTLTFMAKISPVSRLRTWNTLPKAPCGGSGPGKSHQQTASARGGSTRRLQGHSRCCSRRDSVTCGAPRVHGNGCQLALQLLAQRCSSAARNARQLRIGAHVDALQSSDIQNRGSSSSSSLEMAANVPHLSHNAQHLKIVGPQPAPPAGGGQLCSAGRTTSDGSATRASQGSGRGTQGRSLRQQTSR